MPMIETTTILTKKDTVVTLKSMRRYPKESLDEVIVRLIESYMKVCGSQPAQPLVTDAVPQPKAAPTKPAKKK